MVQRVAKINRKKKQAVKHIRYMCDVRMGINKKVEMNEKKKRRKKNRNRNQGEYNIDLDFFNFLRGKRNAQRMFPK